MEGNRVQRCCSSCVETKELITKITIRLEALERYSLYPDLGAQKFSATSTRHNANKRGTVSHVLAEHVGVIGLRESLTWQHRPLKVIWVTLLLAGLAATTYYIEQNVAKYLEDNTATKVSFTQLPEYDIPPLVACPPWPFDDLATSQSMGISMDAFHYSLGYQDSYARRLLSNENYTAKLSKNEFFTYYRQHNFTSLPEYLASVSADPYDISLTDSCENSVLCYGCTHSGNTTGDVRKEIFNLGNCYVFSFPPATSKLNYLAPTLFFGNRNGTINGIQGNGMGNWYLDVLPNVGILGPQIQVGPGAYSVKITTQQMKMRPSAKCVQRPASMNERNPQQWCLEECLNEHQSASGVYFNCITGSAWPGDIMNTFDAQEIFANITIHSLDDLLNVNRSSTSNQTHNGKPTNSWEECDAKCKPPCERIIYDVAVEYSFKLQNVPEIENYSSYIALTFEHKGLRQGFMTWEEMDTMPFSDFVSNVGGTFGLFLGCTFFTIAQLVLSLANYALSARRSGITDAAVAERVR